MADSPIPSSTQQTLDDLGKYANSVPGYGDEVKQQIDNAGLGDTEAGKAVKAGVEGATAGLATGAGVGATVATTAVAVGVLSTGAVALQAIPIAGTIAGAVLGLIAGLVAFFTGKSKAHQAEIAKLQKETHDFDAHLSEAVKLLPAEIRWANTQLWNGAVQQAASDAAHKAGKTTPTEIGHYNYADDPYYYQRLLELLKDIPPQIQASVIDWTAKQARLQALTAKFQAPAAGSSILTLRRVGYAIVGAALIGGIYIAHQRKML